MFSVCGSSQSESCSQFSLGAVTQHMHCSLCFYLFTKRNTRNESVWCRRCQTIKFLWISCLNWVANNEYERMNKRILRAEWMNSHCVLTVYSSPLFVAAVDVSDAEKRMNVERKYLNWCEWDEWMCNFSTIVSQHTHTHGPYTTEFSIFPSRIHTRAPHTYTTALFTHIVYLCQREAQQTHSLIRTCRRNTQANEKQQIAAATALQPEKRMKNVRRVCVCEAGKTVRWRHELRSHTTRWRHWEWDE